MKNKKNKVDFTVGEEIIDNTKQSASSINKNTLFKLQGKEKAAKLLIALGPEQASLILKELSSNEIHILVEEMIKIKKISEREKKEILKEFFENIKNEDAIYTTGKEEAKKILLKAFGDDEEFIENIIKKAEKKDIEKELQFLQNYHPKVVASLLEKEHPQIITTILLFLLPNYSAEILKCFNSELRKEIIFRMAHSTNVVPTGLEKVIEILKNELQNKEKEIHSELGGIPTIIAILNHLDRNYENEILEYLEEIEPELYEKIKVRLYTFEELDRLDFEELRLLLSKIDVKIIATALVGMPEDFKRNFFNALSQNKASDVLFEMDLIKQIPVKKIQDARNYILKQAISLDEEGKIIIKKDKEKFYYS